MNSLGTTMRLHEAIGRPWRTTLGLVSTRPGCFAALVAVLAGLPALAQERKTAPPPGAAGSDSAQKLAEQAAAARRIIDEAPPVQIAVDPVRGQDLVIRNAIIVDKNAGDGVPLMFEVELPAQNGGPVPAVRLRVAPQTFDMWFLTSPSVDTRRSFLNRVLAVKIAAVDRVCQLDADQKRKLELAGEGDLRRLFERVEEERQEFEKVAEDQAKAIALFKKSADLRAAMQSGPFGEGSLFVKTLKRILTAEQWAEYERMAARTTPTNPAKAASGAAAGRTGDR